MQTQPVLPICQQTLRITGNFGSELHWSNQDKTFAWNIFIKGTFTPSMHWNGNVAMKLL